MCDNFFLHDGFMQHMVYLIQASVISNTLTKVQSRLMDIVFYCFIVLAHLQQNSRSAFSQTICGIEHCGNMKIHKCYIACHNQSRSDEGF